MISAWWLLPVAIVSWFIGHSLRSATLTMARRRGFVVGWRVAHPVHGRPPKGPEIDRLIQEDADRLMEGMS